MRSDEHRQQLDGWRLLAGFRLAALTLVVIAVVSYHNSTRLIEDDAWVAQFELSRSAQRVDSASSREGVSDPTLILRSPSR